MMDSGVVVQDSHRKSLSVLENVLDKLPPPPLICPDDARYPLNTSSNDSKNQDSKESDKHDKNDH